MKGIVSTKRIYFRSIDIQDIDNGWLDWINNPLLNKFLVHKKPTTHSDLVEYLNKSKPPLAYMFAVCLVDGDEYIGNVKLGSIDWINRHASYGRLIGSNNSRGLGLGTESLVLLAYYAFYVLNLNRKIRKKMSVIKGGEVVTEVIIQEGIHTEETIEESVAEPVIYMIDRFVVGGFFRVHTTKEKDENLNSPGMHFIPQPFETSCIMPDQGRPCDDEANRFYAYGVIARLALIAASRELQE